ncbi:hypothetical protein H6P81_013079 [Aristolochia fimbriata]|uniref:Uncharacterized protein n=1 Tax=Aristolochia fimbriata TaxID=158543 RepID=A0AAV7EGJ0_ARIFI|nr:hypothetical protein H6P81_013079 [Aristolochia fimbriata]
MASSIRRPIFASIVVFCFSSSLISARSWGRQRKSSITSFCRYYGRAPSASRLLIVASQMLADKGETCSSAPAIFDASWVFLFSLKDKKKTRLDFLLRGVGVFVLLSTDDFDFSCSSLSPTQFTIHGLWANYNDGSWPSCCKGSDFDLNKITPLIGTMERYWPFLTCSPFPVCHGGDGLFWAHELLAEKHGTCSYPVIKVEFIYFSMTLDLYFKHNISEILIDAGYTPNSNGTKYALTKIITTIRNAVGSLPSLFCSDDAFEELRICFYKPRDCDMDSSESSCPAHISLPKFNPILDEGCFN